ncbi:enoyl-CoA hydratase/isomerase family protein, partial [Pantoea sp. SIMBA_072]
AVERYAQAAPDSALAAQQEWIDPAYAHDAAEDIVGSLRSLGGEAAAAADTIEAKSPTSVKVTLESLRRVRGLSLEEALDQEYRVGLR